MNSTKERLLIAGCSLYPELFENNPYSLKVVEDDWRTLKLLDKIGRPSTLLFYGEWFGDLDKIKSPPNHILEEIFIKAGITGKVDIRPYWHAYTDRNNLSINLHDKYVCVQSTTPDSSTPMQNKCWNADRMQNVIKELGKSYKIVQLGTNKEPLLNNVTDGRSLSIKESANLLAHAEFFIGQVGFLMHLARAVETRSVIIYGGRKKHGNLVIHAMKILRLTQNAPLVGKTTVVTSIEHVWRKLKRLM